MIEPTHKESETMGKREQIAVTWIDRHREPQCAPNPDYPKGIDIDASEGGQTCQVGLPYPAKRCGVYVVQCKLCGKTVACTTAGRPDDPRSITFSCQSVKAK